MLISNGAASSVTEASPVASRARIARRVGSASAANVALSGSNITIWLCNLSVKGAGCVVSLFFVVK